ncbi:hypothetical protein F4774DRAFT_381925 [Daldinia eschscholtzii]|nr:hypothetical protein F4774DRAFT_381925 [Daldinia eschscholtzii]
MGYDVNPPDSYSLHTSMDDTTTPKPHLELGTRVFDSFDNLQLEQPQLDNLQDLEWYIPAPEVISANRRVCNQRGPFSNVPAKFYSPDAEFLDKDHQQSPLDADLTPESPESQRAIQSSHSLIKKRACNIEDIDGGQEPDLYQQGKRRRTQSKHTSLPSSSNDYFTIGGVQRVGKLEKNRVAASKCREKKKRETENLQTRAKALTAERKALKFMTDALREEVIELKNEILKHGMCDCQVIQKYITDSARQIA